MVSYFAYRCSLKPWIIKKLGNFQLENCYRDVTDPVMAQVIGAVRVPSEDGTGGTALIHDTQLRMTCNFTDSAIAEFEKKELETSECEFSDLDDALIILERYRLVPTLFSVLNDCVFTVVVYSFRLKSFSKMGGDCSSTRMAHHHFRISKKLKELWGQWKNGDLAFITDESDSTGTVTDMTLSHMIRFMEDQIEAGSEDTPESCKSLSEPHTKDKEQPLMTTGSNDKSNHSRENDIKGDEIEGSLKNPIGLRQQSADGEESTSAVFKVDMPTFKQMKCNEHKECILLIHHTSSHGDRKEGRPADDALVEVLDALPITLYTSFPDDAPRDLPDGLHSWEVDAIDEDDARDGDGRGKPKAALAAGSSSSTVGTLESLSSECQGEGMVSLKWPPSSPSVEESLPASSSAQPVIDGDANVRVNSGGGSSTHNKVQPKTVEAKTKETTSVDSDLSKPSSHENTPGKNGNSFVKSASGALVLDTSDPLLPVMSTANHDEDLETTITEKSQVITGGHCQAKNHSNFVIPESSDSSQESQQQTTTQTLSFERTGISTEAEVNQGEGIMDKEVGQLSAVASKSFGKINAVEASSVDVTSKQKNTEYVIADDAADGKNQEDSSHENQTHLIKGKREKRNYESPSDSKISSGNCALFDQQIETSTKEKTGSLNENERQKEDFILVDEGERTESSISAQGLDGHENAVTCESLPLELQNVSKSTSLSILKCKEKTSSAEGSDIDAGARFGFPCPPKENETHILLVHSPTYPETQPFHVDSDEESHREYPETQMFEVGDPAPPPGHQIEANPSDELADSDWPSETQPFDVAECIASKTSKDQEPSQVSSGNGANSKTQDTQELNCSFQDSPNNVLNNAFLQTKESQDRLLPSQNRTVVLSQEAASTKQIRPRTCRPKKEDQENHCLHSDSNDSLEDIFIKPSENDEQPQIPVSVKCDRGNMSHGVSSRNEQLPFGDHSHLDDTVIPNGIKVRRKRKHNNVVRNTGGIENEDCDIPQKQNKLRRKGSSLTSCGSIPLLMHDKSLAGTSYKDRSEWLTSVHGDEQRNKQSICDRFVEKLRELKCSCGESISDDSHSSSCSSWWSQGTVNCQTSECSPSVKDRSGERESEEKKARSFGNSKPMQKLQQIATKKTTTLVPFGGEKPTKSNEPPSLASPLEVKAKPKPKSNRKHRRMTQEEAAISKRKLTEARFLRWLERNYGLQERRKKGKRTHDLVI